MEFYTQSDLKSQGWTLALIERFLGKPDKESKNSYNKKNNVKLYSINRVNLLIETDSYLRDRLKSRGYVSKLDGLSNDEFFELYMKPKSRNVLILKIKKQNVLIEFNISSPLLISDVVDKIGDIFLFLKDGFSDFNFIKDQTIKFDMNSIDYQYLKEMTEYIKNQENKRKIVQNALQEKPYHENFLCRDVVRKITILEAPTNSGKTYTACRLIKEKVDLGYNKCLAVFPLRALAAQIKDEFMDDGYICSLVTGEERESENSAKITSMTTEIVSTVENFDFVFIDECQMMFDRDRGHAYVKAILGVNAKEIVLAVAPAYKNALIDWLNKTCVNDLVEVNRLERLCPLESENKIINIDKVEKGDVVIAFEARKIHEIAQFLSTKFKVGVIYGKMSPSARRAMVRDFMNLGYDILIATDAIGMGISIPAKRILFSSIHKFDGQTSRVLHDEEIRQIAGRAGRFKYYDIGYYGVFNLSKKELNHVKNVLENPIIEFNSPNNLTVLPDHFFFSSFESTNLTDAINIWSKTVTNNMYKISASIEQLKLKALFLDSNIVQTEINKDKLIKCLYITFPESKDDSWLSLYKKMCKEFFKGNQFYIEPIEKNNKDVTYFENYSIYLTLFSQFQRVFPELTNTEEFIKNAQEECGEYLNELLKKKYAKSNKKAH